MRGNFLQNGIIAVRKPVGFSTFDIIRFLKRETDIKTKIGHGGTLDPFASGVVLLLFGKATNRFEEIKKWEKEYIASLKLGYTSDTFDVEGKIEEKKCYKKPKVDDFKKAAGQFLGEIIQEVPSFSAAKYQGKSLYKLAREGKKVAKTKTITVKGIELIAYKWPLVTFRFVVLGGAYIRTLAADIVKSLNCSGFLFYLERVRVGDCLLNNALSLKELVIKINEARQ